MQNDEKPLIDFNDAKKLFSEETTGKPEVFSPEKEAPEEPIGQLKYHEPENVPSVSVEIIEETTPEKKNFGLTILFWAGVVILAFLVGFSIVNGPAIGKKISFWFDSIRGKTPSADEYIKPNVTVSASVQSATTESLPDNHLIIPKINVDAPVNWNIDDADVQNKLLEGIVHYKKTALPNQDGGNVFMTGHSSNYWWIKSAYNQVFALLPDLTNGDEIIVTYQGVKYVYRVYDKFVVSPDQVEVMNSIEGKSTLTLMSCVPIGTNFRRQIIRSELLFKDEGKGQKQTTAPAESTPGQTTPSGSGEKPVQINGQNQGTTPSTDNTLPSSP